MYSGTTLTKLSGRVIGAHQKIDKIARKHLALLVENEANFPEIKDILHFEGRHGPDGIKTKSPAQDEPWHYYDPYDEDDQSLIEIIKQHYDNLVEELRAKNEERAAFEAAWLAHALVDGLTPAHHYPYEEKLSELRGGEGNETRNTIKDKLILPGMTMAEMIKNNWKMWGPRGLMTTHGLFEIGVATIIAPLGFADAIPSSKEMTRIRSIGYADYFKSVAREIAEMDMFERYYKRGWTTKLSFDVRKKLAPMIIETVTLTWYSALFDASKARNN